MKIISKSEASGHIAKYLELKKSLRIETYRGKSSVYVRSLAGDYIPFFSYYKGSGEKSSPKIELKDSSFAGFQSMVSKYVRRYVSENTGDIKPIEFRLTSEYDGNYVRFNFDLFDTMPVGTLFLGIDIDNSYWQAMYRFGVIPKQVYLKYYHKHSLYKTTKAMSMGLTTSSKEVFYYHNGVLVTDVNGDVFVFSECKYDWDDLYYNVRTWGSNIIYDLFKEVGVGSYVSSTIDSIFFTFDVEKRVLEVLDSMGVDYKILVCRKNSDDSYVYSGKVFKVR